MHKKAYGTHYRRGENPTGPLKNDLIKHFLTPLLTEVAISYLFCRPISGLLIEAAPVSTQMNYTTIRQDVIL